MAAICVLLLYLTLYTSLAVVVGQNQAGTNPNQVHVVSIDECLMIGLSIGGYTSQQIERASRKSKIDKFQLKYGSSPTVYAALWYDLQTTQNPAAWVDVRKVSFGDFLHSLMWLRKYSTEEDRSSNSGRSRTTIRKKGWYFIDRIAALKADKVSILSMLVLSYCTILTCRVDLSLQIEIGYGSRSTQALVSERLLQLSRVLQVV